jgi:hypothetical protein
VAPVRLCPECGRPLPRGCRGGRKRHPACAKKAATRQQLAAHAALYVLDEHQFFRTRWQLVQAAKALWGGIQPSEGYRKWLHAQCAEVERG